MLLRLYKEVNAKGDVLQNYSNDSQKYFHLPSLVDNPPDYWPRSCALGHVQLKPVAKIKRQEVVCMYQEEVPKDKADLLEQWGARDLDV